MLVPGDKLDKHEKRNQGEKQAGLSQTFNYLSSANFLNIWSFNMKKEENVKVTICSCITKLGMLHARPQMALFHVSVCLSVIFERSIFSL